MVLKEEFILENLSRTILVLRHSCQDQTCSSNLYDSDMKDFSH